MGWQCPLPPPPALLRSQRGCCCTLALMLSPCWRAYRYTAAERMDLASKVTNKLERTTVQNYGSHMKKLEVSAVPCVGLISASTAACRPAEPACLQS